LLVEVIDAIKYGVDLSHGVAKKPLNAGLEVVKGLVVAYK